MVEQRYVKKRKRRKLVAFFSSVATLGMGALVLVSFLGNYSGSFTVSLNKGNVKISLSDRQNFGDGEGEGESGNVGSFLKVDDLKPFDQMTFLSLPRHELIDNQDTTYLMGENSSKTLNFFKYTFFVKNMGSISADYNLTVKITDSIPSVEGIRLDSMLRVMLFANDGYDLDTAFHSIPPENHALRRARFAGWKTSFLYSSSLPFFLSKSDHSRPPSSVPKTALRYSFSSTAQSKSRISRLLS